MIPNEFAVDTAGNPTGILLRGIDKLEERLTVIYPNGEDKEPAYVLVRWENRNSVWLVHHVYTLCQETAMALKAQIIEK